MIKAEHRPFIIAIVLSLAVHLGFGLSGIIRPAPKLSEVKTPTIVMRQFSLEQAPPVSPEVAPPPAAVAPKPKNAPPKVDKQQPPVAEEKPQPEKIVEEKPLEKEEVQPEETVAEKPIEEILKPVEDEEEVTPQIVEEENTDPLQNLLEEKQLVAKNPNCQANEICPKEALAPQFPNLAKLKYEGPMGVTGTMNYERQGQNYTIHATFNIPFNKREFIAEGEIQGNNLIAHRYVDKRKGKVYASAIFDRENNTVQFGQGEEPTQNTDEIDFNQTPAYDLFSWAWQVAINGGNMPETVWVTNGKKIYEYHTENAQNGMKESVFDTGEGKLRLLSLPFEREGSSTEYEFSFAPDFANVPALITMTADGKKQTVHLIRVELDGKKHWEARRETGVRNKD
ncbi:MAG: hypothetical protein J6U05_06505 [Neisseriaceae bacterium]|nr:hypothetical protein [Neisseriaceae bacterium]MBO7554850.1 hypothetical protein [Neisseriaceae bacterium]